MGDYQTVAAVSRAIAHVLEGALDRHHMRGEYKVTIASPHQISGDRAHGKSINLFLYHVRPTPSLRNNDLPVYEGGRMVNVPTLGLDLYYLISFYGSKPNDVESERLLGLTACALNAHPLLTQADFQASAEPDRPELGLLDTVAVTPMTLTIEEMQRLWSMFPSVPYTLSMSYCASAALLVGDDVPAPPLPVSRVAPTTTPNAGPLITALGSGAPITFKSRLLITGEGLASSRVAVQIGDRRVPASAVSKTSVEVELTDPLLKAGQQSLSVLWLDSKAPDLQHAPVLAASPPVALTLLPVLRHHPATVIDIQPDGSGPLVHYKGKLQVHLDPLPQDGQNAGVILHRLNTDFAFPGQLDGDNFIVDFYGLAQGQYLIRVEVDGASSLLQPQGGQHYKSPHVTIAPFSRKPRHG
jgi:hypothetical protein